MCKDNTKQGQLIADKIRKVLLNVDLRLVYADGERKLAYEDFKLHSKLGGKTHTKKAIQAKAKYECFKVYISNVNKIKSEVSIGLDAVLSRYSPKWKRIWVMYFIQKACIDDICAEVCYSRENVNKIIQKLKLDLCDFYGGCYGKQN